jgi:hypothetical protein
VPEDSRRPQERKLQGKGGGRETMNNIFWIIGVVVVVLFVLGYFGLR